MIIPFPLSIFKSIILKVYPAAKGIVIVEINKINPLLKFNNLLLYISIVARIEITIKNIILEKRLLLFLWFKEYGKY